MKSPAKLAWTFPLPRTHTGILLGNGTQGLMVWGVDRLCVTVGRAGFWDHRGGTPFANRITFVELRRLLEAGDEAGVRAAFASPSNKRPAQLGCGRVELVFARGVRPAQAELELATATLRIELSNGARVVIRQAMTAELAWIETAVPYRVVTVPTWDHIGAQLAASGVAPPQRWQTRGAGGFCQSLPADPPVALAWSKRGRQLVIATALGAHAADRARDLAQSASLPAAARAARRWWREYWRAVPRVELPDAALQHAWDYGLHKQAGLTPPGGVAATLQGPWMEEYQLPPWSNDYHFNINIEMIYWPVLGTNRLGHFAPLWELVRSWLPRLQENAAKFFGAPDALLLPHAVDDQCQVVGDFWTGTIDQACAAWLAQLAWLHYRHSLDEALLRAVAWPLLRGAFNGYWAMLEPRAGGLSLPVSVSPEFGGSGMNAWGRDASFQLAALHFLAQTLPRAAAVLGEPVDPRWARVRAELPPYSLIDGQRFAVWEGQDLTESHRHHSHLAAIYPFGTIDPRADEHRAKVAASLRHWLRTGPGQWTGWCVPWAAILCARCDLADAAVTWLHLWKDVWTNVGHGTLHDADYPGVGAWCPQPILEPAPAQPCEIMQMDAGMGAVTALLELLAQQRGATLHVLPRIPTRWRTLRFDGVRVEGAFLVGATVAGGRATEVRVTSLAGAPLRLAHGLGDRWTLNGKPRRGAILATPTKPGQQLTLRGGAR